MARRGDVRGGGRDGERDDVDPVLEQRRAKRSAKNRTLIIAALVVAGLGVVACGGTGAVILITQKAANRPIPRDEFRAKVMGKTPAEVLDAVGRPVKTTEDTSNQYWYYQNLTFDPITSRSDDSVQVVFDRGRVIAVNY